MSDISAIISLAIGTAIGMIILVFLVPVVLQSRKNKEEEDEEDVEANKCGKGKDTKSEQTTRRYGNVHISTFEKTVPRMRLNNLLKATNNFSKNNIIGSGRAGTVYKAMLLDGSSLAI